MVTLTPEARSELTQRISRLEGQQCVVLIIWAPATRNLVRSKEGRAVWEESIPPKWLVLVRVRAPGNSLDPEHEHLVWPPEHAEWLQERLVHVDGIDVFFDPGATGVRSVVVSYALGEFLVQPIAA
jgi:hypothetical protein